MSLLGKKLASLCVYSRITIPCATNSGRTQQSGGAVCQDRICGDVFNSETSTNPSPVYSEFLISNVSLGWITLLVGRLHYASTNFVNYKLIWVFSTIYIFCNISKDVSNRCFCRYEFISILIRLTVMCFIFYRLRKTVSNPLPHRWKWDRWYWKSWLLPQLHSTTMQHYSIRKSYKQNAVKS